MGDRLFLCIVIGAIVGLINGLLVTRARINSFIATLGSGTLLLGLNQWYTGGPTSRGVLPRTLWRSQGIFHTPEPDRGRLRVGGGDRALGRVRLSAARQMSLHHR